MCEDDERILFDSDVCQSICDDFCGSYYYFNINDLLEIYIFFKV